MPEEGTGVRYMLGGGSTLSIVHGTPTPYTISQEIYMEWTAGEGVTLPAGIWIIVLYPREIREGVCNLWMSGIEASGSQTGFLMPVTNTTLTIPATADRIVSVGGVSDRYDGSCPIFGERIYSFRAGCTDTCSPGCRYPDGCSRRGDMQDARVRRLPPHS